MDSFTKSVYALEIAKQCQFAIDAIGQLNHSLGSMRGELSQESHRMKFFHNEVFRSIHSFLTHTSNISRLLWPALPTRGNGESDSAYEARVVTKPSVIRSRVLRAEFGLTDEHVLKSRRLRDLLDHFDEKLDEWRTTSKHRNIVNDYIGPKNGIVGVADTDMMRWFDPSTKVFTFRGEVFNLQSLATEVERMLPIALQVEERMRDALAREGVESHNKSLKPTLEDGEA